MTEQALVVRHYTRGVDGKGPQETVQYLVCINHNPYNRHDQDALSTMYTEYVYQAFRFTSRHAAEFAACFVGGDVVPLPE